MNRLFYLLIPFIFLLANVSNTCAAMSDDDFVELCRYASPEQIKQALKDGANPQAENERGETALSVAVQQNKKTEVIVALIDAGAARGEDGQQEDTGGAIFRAAGRKPLDSRLLPALRQGILRKATRRDFDEWNRNADKAFPFHQHGDADKTFVVLGQFHYPPNSVHPLDALFIIPKGVPAPVGDSGNSFIFDWNTGAGGRNLFQKQDERVSLAQWGSPKLSDAFIDLCKKGDSMAIASAIRNGANMAAKNQYGETPLIYAARFNKDPKVTALLLQAGADPKVRDTQGLNALDYARENKNTEVAALLLAHQPGEQPKTALAMSDMAFLHFCRFATAKQVKQAIQNGAHIGAQDENGKTALDYAEESGNSKAAKILREALARPKQNN